MSYTVLVMSCDKNVKLLDCFFKYYFRFCGDSDAEIVVGLEESGYQYKDKNIRVHNGKPKTAWAARLKSALKTVETSAVLVLLDDFIVESAIDLKELEKLSDLIETDDSIAHFALTTVPMKNASDTIYFERYYQRAQFGRYKATLQAGMWRRDELLSILNDKESAWQTEDLATIRSFVSKRKYYAIARKEWKPIDYNDGWFCLQGKLNLNEKQRLEKKLSESFDVEGFEDNKGIIQRDATPFFGKVRRKLKILWLSAIYRIKAIF